MSEQYRFETLQVHAGQESAHAFLIDMAALNELLISFRRVLRLKNYP